MGENGKLLQIHHGKCMKLFQQERKMEENGVEMGGKWVKNGTRAGPIVPIFPKDNLLPHRAVNKKPGIQVSGWKNGGNGGIRRYPENWILHRLAPCTRRSSITIKQPQTTHAWRCAVSAARGPSTLGLSLCRPHSQAHIAAYCWRLMSARISRRGLWVSTRVYLVHLVSGGVAQALFVSGLNTSTPRARPKLTCTCAGREGGGRGEPSIEEWVCRLALPADRTWLCSVEARLGGPSSHPTPVREKGVMGGLGPKFKYQKGPKDICLSVNLILSHSKIW